MFAALPSCGICDLIAEQLRDLAEAYIDFNATYSRPVSVEECNAILRFKMPELLSKDDLADDLLSEHALCQEALRIMASTLVRQGLQIDNALADFRRTLNAREPS